MAVTAGSVRRALIWAALATILSAGTAWADRPDATTGPGVVPLAAPQVTDTAKAPGTVALAIGNGAYVAKQVLPPLPHAQADAQAVLDALAADGQSDVLRIQPSDNDLTWQQMWAALAQLQSEAVAKKSGMTFFYYAGHGGQIGGVNYLFPVDFDPSSPKPLDQKAVRLDTVISTLAAARSPLLVIVLDACRRPADAMHGALAPPGATVFQSDAMTVNWLPGDQLAQATAGGDHFLPVTAQPGILIVYSTAPGGTALDGEPKDNHSPYATAFLHHLTEPADLASFLTAVGNELSHHVSQQQWASLSDIALPHSFYLHRPQNVAEYDRAIWASLDDVAQRPPPGPPYAFPSLVYYLSYFPQGIHRADALALCQRIRPPYAPAPACEDFGRPGVNGQTSPGQAVSVATATVPQSAPLYISPPAAAPARPAAEPARGPASVPAALSRLRTSFNSVARLVGNSAIHIDQFATAPTPMSYTILTGEGSRLLISQNAVPRAQQPVTTNLDIKWIDALVPDPQAAANLIPFLTNAAGHFSTIHVSFPDPSLAKDFAQQQLAVTRASIVARNLQTNLERIGHPETRVEIAPSAISWGTIRVSVTSQDALAPH